MVRELTARNKQLGADKQVRARTARRGRTRHTHNRAAPFPAPALHAQR